MVNTASVMNDRLWELEVDVNLVSVSFLVLSVISNILSPQEQMFVTPLHLLSHNDAKLTSLRSYQKYLLITR